MLRIPVSVDFEFRGIEYRLAEGIRERGASVRASSRHVACTACDRNIRQYSSVVLAPNANYHPACAIRVRCLIPVGGPS
jgi:hypothetical protein